MPIAPYRVSFYSSFFFGSRVRMVFEVIPCTRISGSLSLILRALGKALL